MATNLSFEMIKMVIKYKKKINKNILNTKVENVNAAIIINVAMH